MKDKYKDFSEATDKEIWFNFRITEKPGFISEIDTKRLMDFSTRGESDMASVLGMIYGDDWCCKVARRFKRVKCTQTGIILRVHFCPRCGKYLGD